MTDPRIVFAGTPDFAALSLSALVSDQRNIVAVYTQPDRPAGRGRRLTASPVKRFAEDHGIAVFQPPGLRDAAAQAEMQALRPDIVVVAAYGLILPQAVLDIPRHGCLNVHASLLPRWRGAAPIQAAILAGDAETGVSLMSMEAGLDTGPVFSSRTIPIDPDVTAGELHDRLAVLGGDLLVAELDGILRGDRIAVAQNEADATYAGKISKQDAELDWQLGAAELHRRIRAYNPVPGAWFIASTASGPLRIKVWKSSVLETADDMPGTVTCPNGDTIVVACGDGSLQLTELQAPGRRRASAREFLHQVDLL